MTSPKRPKHTCNCPPHPLGHRAYCPTGLGKGNGKPGTPTYQQPPTLNQLHHDGIDLSPHLTHRSIGRLHEHEPITGSASERLGGLTDVTFTFTNTGTFETPMADAYWPEPKTTAIVTCEVPINRWHRLLWSLSCRRGLRWIKPRTKPVQLVLNDVKPTALIKADTKLTDEDFADFKSRWQAAHAPGNPNRYNYTVLPSGGDHFDRWMRRGVNTLALVCIACVAALSWATGEPEPVIGGTLGAAIVWTVVRVILRATR